MIEIQLVALEKFPAVLAGVVVALEDVVPGEFHFLFRQSIEEQQHDHARDTDLPRDRRHHFVLGFGRADREVAPAVEIMGREIILLIGPDNLGMALVKEGEGTTRRADVHRLPEAVENQDLTVE